MIQVRELIGWPLDDYAHRPSVDAVVVDRAAAALVARETYRSGTTLLACETSAKAEMFAKHAMRVDLQDEMRGLDWSFGVVDLRCLLAFQRRLSLRPGHRIQLDAFGPAKPIDCTTTECGGVITVRTSDPNLHLRVVEGEPRLHAGSPFFEVAEYRGRWFLRDGYHRAYAMLRAGVTQCEALVVHARTLKELGATQAWFFAEEILFSARPPHVTDFLDDALNIEYTRPPLIRTLRVRIEESTTTEPLQASQGDPL